MFLYSYSFIAGLEGLRHQQHRCVVLLPDLGVGLWVAQRFQRCDQTRFVAGL